MEIRLNRLQIEYFKGIKRFTLELDGDDAVIKAENGVGKTTIYDSFLWLLFGKNSDGKKDFEVRPLDEENQPIKGLVLAVEAEIAFGDEIHCLRKENHEKVIKNQTRGYESLCFIDLVPKKLSEFQEWITDRIAEDTFKLLTNLRHFNEGLHWTDRRKILLDIAGNIGSPKGFDELLAALNGRSVDDYRKVLQGQKDRYKKDREEINPRIDEITRNIPEESDTKDAAKKRDTLKAEIKKLDDKRNELFAKEKERQQVLDYINDLKRQQIRRESEISNGNAFADLLEEKTKLETIVSEKRQAVNDTKSAVVLKESEIRNDRLEMESRQKRLSAIREQYKQVKDKPLDDNCYACGQKLPAEKIAVMEEKRQADLKELAENGNKLLSDVNSIRTSIEDDEKKLAELKSAVTAAETKLENVTKIRNERFASIDYTIKNRPAPDFTKDARWIEIGSKIAESEKQIGKPVSEQLQELEQQRTVKNNNLLGFNNILAQADRIKADKARILELEAKEKELAQRIADVDKQLADIEAYKMAESKMIESAVNGKFKHVEFKLFNFLLNGSIEDCCDATFNGIPYSDMSTGQQIYCGIDIVNVLSGHYGISVPLFIDHSESLTLPLESNSQTIELFAAKGVKKLEVCTSEKVKEMLSV